jgi:hypothetical protein
MSLDPGWILLELLLGGVGFVLFTYGRKQARLPYLLAGFLFMVYPFFVTGSIGLIVGAILIGGGTWWAVRMGW